jgi:hypothetical protein
MDQQELRLTVGLCKLRALSELIETYAYRNRAKMVQRLLEIKHQLEEKLELNKPIQAQYGLQNQSPNGKLLGEFTDHNKGGLNCRGSSI